MEMCPRAVFGPLVTNRIRFCSQNFFQSKRAKRLSRDKLLFWKRLTLRNPTWLTRSRGHQFRCVKTISRIIPYCAFQYSRFCCNLTAETIVKLAQQTRTHESIASHSNRTRGQQVPYRCAVFKFGAFKARDIASTMLAHALINAVSKLTTNRTMKVTAIHRI